MVVLEHMSNFTDFQALALDGACRLRYAHTPGDLEGADLIILPGSKNTIQDLLSLRRRGMEGPVLRHARAGGLVLGVCGGFQMLGRTLRDPLGVESPVQEAAGLGLLDMDVSFLPHKTTAQASARVDCPLPGWAPYQGMAVQGYEIHAGQNAYGPQALPWLRRAEDGALLGACNPAGNVLGTYLHGLFDGGQLSRALLRQGAGGRSLPLPPASGLTLAQHREAQLDLLAQAVRRSLDMALIYRILRGEA